MELESKLNVANKRVSVGKFTWAQQVLFSILAAIFVKNAGERLELEIVWLGRGGLNRLDLLSTWGIALHFVL